MNKIFTSLLIFSILCTSGLLAQTSSLKVVTSVSESVSKDFKNSGRIFLFIGEQGNREPRYNTWPNKNNRIFATNIENWNPGKTFTFNKSVPLVKSVDVSLGDFPNGKYSMQVLWDQDTNESGINAP